MWDWDERVHFNLSAGIWRGTDAFPVLVPDVRSTAALFPWPYASLVSSGPLEAIALPAGTDVRDTFSAGGSADFIECPIGSGRWYQVLWFDDVRKGLPGEYRVAVMQKTGNQNSGGSPWPAPAP